MFSASKQRRLVHLRESLTQINKSAPLRMAGKVVVFVFSEQCVGDLHPRQCSQQVVAEVLWHTSQDDQASSFCMVFSYGSIAAWYEAAARGCASVKLTQMF